ncbi:MAG TPA: hypothetical protein VKQ36_08990, partial [Ktedonobacterales bacterium]|nr:hypothetical protein [Ktedonobacterales bacterium]
MGREYPRPYRDRDAYRDAPYRDTYRETPYRDGPRPYREMDRPPYREGREGDRPYSERAFGDRPFGDRPYGERPYGERPFGEGDRSDEGVGHAEHNGLDPAGDEEPLTGQTGPLGSTPPLGGPLGRAPGVPGPGYYGAPRYAPRRRYSYDDLPGDTGSLNPDPFRFRPDRGDH